MLYLKLVEKILESFDYCFVYDVAFLLIFFQSLHLVFLSLFHRLSNKSGRKHRNLQVKYLSNILQNTNLQLLKPIHEGHFQLRKIQITLDKGLFFQFFQCGS